MGQTGTSKLISVLEGTPAKRPPVWMMRQAGRHLPEYLELRARAKDFLDFCYTPSMATEATLQPVRRYGMDAAILFADILLILDAMGLGVEFEKGVGPLVQQIDSASDLGKVPAQKAADRLAPVYETVSRVRAELPKDTALIGFAGSPWTVSLYAIEGRGKTDKSLAWRWAHGRPDELAAVMDHVIEATAHYLVRQVEAGADALMLFDSWAEGLPDNIFREVIIRPTAKLVTLLRDMGVTVPVIGFPRGAAAMLPEYAAVTGVTAVGLDTAAVPSFVNASLPPQMPVQGHLDPLLLIEGGERLDARVRELVAAYQSRPHIFNLGHGIRPETPIANVERVLKIIREG
ncbi:MAG: uroporphyrinogen decarboxylase [Hyphomonas sp. BRH_c22]|uniref:uroporphyrinogen decarboxylase n=1 Tax=Hyphomonas sp. BRH_c22 TaxID=1629710 RepID=UPI0005F0EF9D|nr:uroporphyrinogen decarboxylase [Hyphomonas sp. BRH_c22]KJS39001.1 MAG: uroporphyrinogen decarboxylase [Hyphomonas sp. BRH_c22]